MGIEETPDRWSDWLKKAQDGDKECYRKFLEEAYLHGSRFLARRVTSSELREELLQEALLAMHRGLASYDRNYPARAWVYSILRNKLTDHFRKQGREEVNKTEIELLIEMTTSHSPEDILQENQWLNDSLALLPKLQRTVFCMVQIEGQSLAFTSEKLGITLSNVKMSLRRGRELLKSHYLDGGRV